MAKNTVNMTKGIITEIKRFATHDGPGIRTTVFTKGCPLRCKWCSNPETWVREPQLYFISRRCQGFGECLEKCPEGAITRDPQHKVEREKCTGCMLCTEVCPYRAFTKVGEKLTVAEVVSEVEKDLPFYGKDGGVTVSGGEPFSQFAFTLGILQGCKEKGMTTVLDTTAYTSKENIELALQYTDLFLLDLKHMDPERHKEGTGAGNERILENAELIAEKGKVRISLPLIPGFNDSEDNLVKTAEFVKSLGVEWVDVNPLHKLGAGKYEFLGMVSPYESFPDLSKDDVRRARKILAAYGLKTSVGRMM